MSVVCAKPRAHVERGIGGFQFMVGARYALDEQKSVGFSYRFSVMGATSALAQEPGRDNTVLLDLRLAL